MMTETYTATTYPDDLRDVIPGVPEDEAIVGRIRIFDEADNQVDLVTYPAVDDESQAAQNMLDAIDAAGYDIVDDGADGDPFRVTVTLKSR